MAEKPAWVRDFDRPKGTEIKCIRGRWYLYECSSVHDPGLGRSRKVSGRILGSITEDGFTESPARRREREAAEGAAAAQSAPPADVVEAGAASYVWQRTEGMRERLARLFPDIWRQIYAVAALRAAGDPRLKRVQGAYEDSVLSYMMPGLALSPSSLTGLLRDLGGRRDAIAAYMREDLAGAGALLLADGHRMVSASSTLGNAERGYDSRMRYKPQVNLMYLFSLDGDSGRPAYYKQFLGSTPDVTALPDVVAEAGADAEGVTLVGDKGCGSAPNFEDVAEAGLHYVIAVKRGGKELEGRVPATASEWDGAFTYRGRAVLFKSYPSDDHVTHLFLDRDLLAQETADLVARKERENASRLARRERELARREKGEGRMTDGELARLEPVGIASEIAALPEMGTVALRTDREDLPAEDAYLAYKRRQAIEQFFKAFGDVLGSDASYMRSDRSLEGWLFLSHLSSCICVGAVEEIAAAGESKSVSYRDLMQTLSRVKACRTSGGWTTVPMKKSARALCAKIGFDPTDLSPLGLPD